MEQAQEQPDDAYRIFALEVENFKRVEYVRIEPAEGITTIGGANRQGKTSVLDGIEALFSGKRAIPAEPIKRGARRARIRAELGGKKVELTVELELAAGATKLRVLDEHGEPIAKPQTFLNGLFSEVSFDPLAFARMDPEDQDKVLRELDRETSAAIEAIDAEYRAVFEQRADVNRDVKSLAARLEAAPHYPDAPAQEESLTELAAELRRRQEAAAEKRRLESEAASADAAVQNAERAAQSTRDKIAELERQLAAAREELAEREEHVETARKAAVSARDAADSYTFQDPAEIGERLAMIETMNAHARANKARAALDEELREKEREARRLTDILEGLKEQKAQLLANAKFPVPGLGFDELGPTYQGLPLEQASHSDLIKISAAIGMALHPKLRVLLIRDGEKVGSQDMAILRELARENGYQIFMEKFTESGDGCNVVLEDGKVKTPPAVAAE